MSAPHRLVLLALGALLALGGVGLPARAAPLALADCRLEHPAGLGSLAARCGTLAVPENPAEPGGRMITLKVAVVPALDRHRTREPLFILAGGPGQAASDFYVAYAAAFAPVQRRHDVVLLDQRGTGGSNRLGCDFPPDFDVATPSPARIRELSGACRRALAGRPEYYTTSVAVKDLDAVRAALGAERLSLYGISYGTRVAQHYLRRYPSRVAAVVLDGVVPPGADLMSDTALAAERALDLAFARCAAETDCASAFPDLAARFRALKDDLARRPRHLNIPDPSSGVARTLEFDAAALAGTVRLLNYQATTTALLPYLVDRAARDDLVPLAAERLLLGQRLDAEIAYGMGAAVSCSEDPPARAHPDRAALAATYLGSALLDDNAALCEGWPAGVVDADLDAPLDSSVPALLLSGEADPVTPPAYGARAARGFRDQLHLVVKGQGHGQFGVGCMPRLIARFLDAGTARGLDTRCLDAVDAAPFVLDPSGPAP